MDAQPAPSRKPSPEDAAAVEKVVEIETRLVATLYEKGASYTNLVVAAGYATFFALWTLTKPYLPRTPALWAALLMLASATSFVFFEVYKMWQSSSALSARYLKLKQLIAGRPIAEVLAEHKKAEQDIRKFQLTVMPLWRICLGVSVLTGLGAVSILAVVFIVAIFNGAA